MNYTKAEVLESEAVMNQMRNAIYHLARFVEKAGKTDIKERLRKMGRNIARTLHQYWKPIEIVTTSNVRDVISTIYKKILISSVSIEIENDHIHVKDNDCALCKYHYEDVYIAGCEIILGMVSEFVSLISRESKHISSIYLDPVEVDKSKAYGDTMCIQVYKIKQGGA
ncbi:MAG: hypothetical protein EU539_10855 [Promethearchaeota archaeon]|nr:MAG: hypothetical protein EU539_10855 [Candidatus Lokiarchaeota archaeon]